MISFLKNISKIKREQIYFLFLIIFIITYPITYNSNSQILIAMSIFFFIDTKANLKYKFGLVKRNKIVIVFILYFMIQLIGLTYTEDIKRGVNVITRLLPFLLLPTIIISEKISNNKLKLLLKIMTLWILLVMIYLCLYQIVIEERSLNTMVHFAFDKLGISQHYVSIILVLSIMFCVHEIFLKEKIFFNVIISVSLIFFLLLFSSRSSLVILLFSLVVFFLKEFKDKSISLKLTVITSVFAIVTLGFFSSSELQKKTNILLKSTDFDIEIIKTKNSITFAKNTIEQRVMINLASLNIIKENPFFGVGTGDYLNALQAEYVKLNFIAGIKERFNAHNQYFEDYIKVGILGFLSIIILMVIIVKESYKKKSYMFYCAFAIVFMCLFESFFARHHGTVFTAFFIPLFYKFENQMTFVEN